VHNLRYYQSIMANLRAAIDDGAVGSFIERLKAAYGDGPEQ
jgi:queuine/archaeosine tRNA-ribosyltransferase